MPEHNEYVNNNDLSIEEIKASVKHIDEKVVALDTEIKKEKNMVYKIETFSYKYSQIEKE